MSIWCRWEGIGYEEIGAKVEPIGNGEVRSYAKGWSNHYPTTDGTVEQPAQVGIAHIPTWCVPGHTDELDDEAPFGPWLRLDVDTTDHAWRDGLPTGERKTASVVLDEQAARALAADLLAWADQPKAHPITAREGATR